MLSWGDRVTIVADGAPVTTPRGPAQQDAKLELLKPEYHRHDPSLLQRISSWLWDRLDDLLGRLGSAVTDGSTGLILFIVLAVLVGAALWWRLGRPRRAARTAATALFTPGGPRSAEQHRAAAHRHAAGGDFAA
ncbi:DUF4129 domain-containing protein, partial [Kitasatospora sp. LaBMicrA B282]